MLSARPKPGDHQNSKSGNSYQTIPRKSIGKLPEGAPKTPRADNRWAGDYLKDLRTNRPARPTGARPPPARNDGKTPRASMQLLERATSAMGFHEPMSSRTPDIPERSASAMSHRQSQAARGPREMIGSPIARPPMTKMRQTSGTSQNTMNTSTTVTSQASKTSDGSDKPAYKIPYYERGQRWMEKQEMSSLRRALEEKDLVQEKKIFDSAQDEAADLVWKHQNPGVPYANPEKVDYRGHLKKGSHARTLSNTPYETLYVRKGGADGSRSASDGSSSGHRSASDGSQGSSGSRSGRFSNISFSMRSSRVFGRNDLKKGRTVSKGSQNSIFANPDDKIYEAAEDFAQTTQDPAKPLPLKIKPRNTSYGSKSLKDKIASIEEKSEHSTPIKNVSIVDIYKNPPSQSRNAHYRINKELPITPETLSDSPSSSRPNTRDGKEIRGEDIRAATSMSLKDRSSKLPMPTVVSDRPGRPIVSFKKDYQPRRKELYHESSSRGSSLDLKRDVTDAQQPAIPMPPVPFINVPDVPVFHINDQPAIPTISLPDEQDQPVHPQSIPTINIGIEDHDTPSISITPSVPLINAPTTSARPLPQPTKRSSPFARPLPTQAGSSIAKSAPHWSPAMPRGTAQCAACALPIAGKIVSASSKRFHPHCFTCFCCGELLECVAFYPEPENFRVERLSRIQARFNGTPILESQRNFTEEDDGDDSLRFYCHLDFHERFSPRCKSCKTPIEGQAIVACGAEWHVGHFFCAECGDPFEADVPFVEKDGFAWCVNCHTKRYSGKCAGCRRPITDLVVTALGKEWHGQCFRCKECGGDFDDGRFFTRGGDEIPVCVKCEEKRLKA